MKNVQSKVKKLWKELQFEDLSINKINSRDLLEGETHQVVVEFMMYAPIVRMPYGEAHRLTKEELINSFLHDC